MPVFDPGEATGLTFDAIVDRARAIAPEVPQATVVLMANARLNRMIAEAKFRRKTFTIGTTVADTAIYSIPANVTDIRSVWIGTDEYSRQDYRTIRDLLAGRRDLIGEGGVVAPYEDDSGNPAIYLYPTPSTSGDDIEADASYEGSDIAYGGGSYTILPAHIRSRLLDGVLADVYEFTGRWDEAQPHEQRYEEGITLLRREKNSRVGSGPSRIKVLAPGQY